MASELAVKSESTALENPDKLLAEVRAMFIGRSVDLTTAKGRAEISAGSASVSRLKVRIDGDLKSLSDKLKEELKARTGAIDSARKTLRDGLDAIRDEVRAPLTQWEAEQEARKAEIENNLKLLNPQLTGEDGRSLGADVLRAQLQRFESVNVNGEQFGDRAGYAMILRDAAIRQLTGAISEQESAAAAAEAAKKAAEAAAAAATALRLENEAKEKAAAEYRRALELKLAEERAKSEAAEKFAKETAAAEARAIAAEKARVESAAKSEADRIAAAELAEKRQQQAIEAERARAAAEQRRADEEREAAARKIEAERLAREADREHRATVNRNAAAALEKAGLDKGAAKLSIIEIAAGRVPGVTINY